MKISMKRKWKYLLVIPVIIIVAFFIYASSYYKAMNNTEAFLRTNARVEYRNSSFIEFLPKGNTAQKGFIFYPGGKVDPKAYVPMAEKLAESGMEAAIVPMPFNLAVLAPNSAVKVIQEHPEIKEWYVGGHSLGGVMAAQFAYSHQDKIKGLILLASYPQATTNLSKSTLKVLSIYGSKDAFVGKDKIDASRSLLPSSTVWDEIIGGNHSQMGWYGLQKGDNAADITREQQQDMVVKAIVEFIN